MKVLFVINDAPYGSEKAYNALRLAMAMQAGNSEVEIRIFLMADSGNLPRCLTSRLRRATIT